MFEISIPIEADKGYMVSTFQAGNMDFPESMWPAFPHWSPIDYIRHCLSDLERFLSGEQETACVPASVCSFDGLMVPDCYWGFNWLDDGRIGFNQFFRCERKHFNGVHSQPEDWWKDVKFRTMNESWGVTERSSMANWVDSTKQLIEYADGKSFKRDLTSHNKCFTLTPFMRCGEKRDVCVLGFPSANSNTIIESELSNFPPKDFLIHWQSALIRLLDGLDDVVALAFEINEQHFPIKWIGVKKIDSSHLGFSPLQINVLDGCLIDADKKMQTVTEKAKREIKNACLMHMAVVVDIEVDRWIYWAATVLNGINCLDKDPEVDYVQDVT